MFQISVRGHFDAAHYLRGYGGRCESLHGHRFQVVVRLEAQGLNDIGLAFDFVELKRHLGEIIERFDHTCLNEVPPFDEVNPSSENIATTIYKELSSRLREEQASISSVEVWESPESCVAYIP